MRANVGINPIYLTDNHIVAESVELTMVTGLLRVHNNAVKGAVPAKFNLGKGHMLFFTNKLVYLARRLKAVNDEMIRRGMNPGTRIDLDLYPPHLKNDWNPTEADRDILIRRIKEKMMAKPDLFWRHRRIRLKTSDAVALLESCTKEAPIV